MVGTPKLQTWILWGILVIAIFVPRLTSLGTTLTIDEPLWISRGQTFIMGFASGQFNKTLVAGQPGVTTAWLVGLTTPSESLALKQASIAITTGFLILLASYLFVRLYGECWGLVIGHILALEPFLIGHSRVVHTDALQALFYLCSTLALIYALTPWPAQKEAYTRYILLSALGAAGAILTKIFALFIIPTALVIITIQGLRQRLPYTKLVQAAGVWISALVLATFLAWPALWFNAGQVADLLGGRATAHAEGTRSEETTSLSWYYEREFLFRLSAVATFLIPFGCIYIARHRTTKASQVTLLIVGAGLAFAAALSVPSDKSDRYILFTMISVIPLAALGIREVVNLLIITWPPVKKAAPILIAAPLIFLALDDARLHPYYLATYNRFYPIESTHKLGWGEGLEQAAQWIQEKQPGAKVLSYYPRVFSYFYDGEVETITHVNDAKADYIVLYRSMFERGEDSAEADILREYLYSGKHTPAHVVTINGLPYAWIFKSE